MKKFSNKILLIVLIALAAVLVATKLFRNPARETNLNVDVLAIDTAQVTRVTLTRDSGKVISFDRTKQTWTVSMENTTAQAAKAEVSTLLRSLASLRPERLVTKNDEKWDEYGVGEDNSIALDLYGENKPLKAFLVGKESRGKTYIRVKNEDEVYLADGYIRSTLNKDFERWRDATLLRLEKEDLTRIAFTYPADSSFTLERSNNKWMIRSTQADSATVVRYLNKIRSKNHRSFIDDFTPATDPDVTVTFSTSQGDVVLKAWNTAFYEWVYNCSQRPDVYFIDTKMTLAEEILKGEKYFFGGIGDWGLGIGH